MTISQLSVFAENSPGILYRLQSASPQPASIYAQLAYRIHRTLAFCAWLSAMPNVRSLRLETVILS